MTARPPSCNEKKTATESVTSDFLPPFCRVPHLVHRVRKVSVRRVVVHHVHLQREGPPAERVLRAAAVAAAPVEVELLEGVLGLAVGPQQHGDVAAHAQLELDCMKRKFKIENEIYSGN